MATLSRYLRRFQRLVAPPGRPARVGVAATPTAGPPPELGEVLEAVDAIRQEADRIRDGAVAEAERVRADAADGADRVLAQAQRRAATERDEVAAAHRSKIDDRITASLAAADAEASQVRARAAGRVDELAERIVRDILRPDLPAAEPTGPPSDGVVAEAT